MTKRYGFAVIQGVLEAKTKFSYRLQKLVLFRLKPLNNLGASRRQSPDFFKNGGPLRDRSCFQLSLEVVDFRATMSPSLDFFLSFATCHANFPC